MSRPKTDATNEPWPRRPFSHPPDQHFETLVDYLRHLVDVHGIEETPELWRSGRDTFDEIHAREHAAIDA